RCGLVEQRDAVPQQVAVAPGHEQRALADGEARLGADAGEAGLVAELVAMRAGQLGRRRPPLAVGRDVLARVLADRAALGRTGELDPAGGADGQHAVRSCHGGAVNTPFLVSDGILIAGQASLVALPAAGIPPWLDRLKGRAWALILPLSVAVVVG